MTFSEQLKELRRELRITQAQAERILQVPHRTYQDWERGIATPPEYVQRLIIAQLRNPSL